MSGNQSALMGGDRPPTSIINYFSSGGEALYAIPAWVPCKSTLSGALTAGALKTLLNISGAGVLKFIGVQALDATSRTLRLKITIDGTVAFDSTSAACTTSYGTKIGVGGVTVHTPATPSFVPALDREPFNSSCIVEIASSLTETDKLALLHAYEAR